MGTGPTGFEHQSPVENFAMGPWIQAALFCDKLLFEQDGVPSVIRVIDQIRIPMVLAAGEEPQPWSHLLNGLVALKPGNARGRMEYSIEMEAPNGLRKTVITGSFSFAGAANNGVNIPFQLPVTFDGQGLYWFALIVEDRLLTRMPFYVEYQIMRPEP